MIAALAGPPAGRLRRGAESRSSSSSSLPRRRRSSAAAGVQLPRRAAAPAPASDDGHPDATSTCWSAARRVLNVGAPIARVSLTVPDIADAMVTAPTQLLIHGKTPGTISLFVWDKAGAIKTLRGHRPARPQRAHRADASSCSPASRSPSRGSGKDVVLSGTVSSKYVDREGGGRRRRLRREEGERRQPAEAAGRRGLATRCCCACASPK